MQDHAELTRRLADLVVGFGANVQPGQLVGVTSFLGKEELTREIARAAYERGASFVDVIYVDQWLKRERLIHADRETLTYIPPWMIDRLRYLSDQHAARITLSGPSSPHALDDVPEDRSGIDCCRSARGRRGREAPDDELGAVPAPTVEWAKLVFPDDEPAQALRPALGGGRARLPPRRGRPRRRLGSADAHAQRRPPQRCQRAAVRRDPPHGPGTD